MSQPSQVIPVHPVADLFPMLPDEELRDLADDIKANGLQQPIVMQGDTLIDGRNRLAACELAGVEPSFTELNGSDPVQFILSANLARRHMTKSQRAMAAAKTSVFLRNNQTEAAKAADTSQPMVAKAAQVLEADSPLADQVLAGTIPLNEAYSKIQERRKEVERIAAQRQRLHELAPDLDDQVSEEVLKLTEALEQAQTREQEEKEKREDARDLLDRILTLIAPAHATEEFIDAWAERVGDVSAKVKESTRQAGEALLALAERMDA